MAGVVGAMMLGVGLGLWARPAPLAPPSSAAKLVAPEDAPRPALQIVVDDDPAPIGPLLEVLPGDAAPIASAAVSEAPVAEVSLPAQNPEPAMPRRPAAGLMKVDTVVVPAPLPVAPVKIAVKPKVEPKSKAEPATARLPDKPKIQKAKVELKPKPEKATIAAAKVKKVEKVKAEKVKAERFARAEKVRAEKVRKAKAEEAKATKLAKADARRVKAQKPKAEPTRLASVATPAKAKAVKAVKAAPKALTAKAANRPAVEKASSKPNPVAKKPLPARKPVPRGEGPMRIARNDACASPDPGAAAVCADRSLTARDRQMQQAYRNAEAAGVPPAALRRQQARWLQARAAAAREATWAVEDVYTARISELNDLTRDARDN